jgi:hypothetical protein
MRGKLLLILGLIVASFLCLGVAEAKKPLELRLESPKDQDVVDSPTFITGWVSDPSAKVWVIIHDMASACYGVQRRLTVRSNGHWKVYTYSLHEVNELVVVGNPRKPLEEGKCLKYWPKAEVATEMIEIKRK